MQTIDYEPLQQDPRPEDLSAAKATKMFSWVYGPLYQVVRYLILVPYVIIVGVVVLLAVTSYRSNHVLADLTVYALQLLFLLGAPLAMVVYFRSELKRRAKICHFAAVNSMSVLFDQGAPAYSGLIFSQGRERELPIILRKGEGPQLVEVGTFQYVTGSGKNRTTHRRGYVRMKLPRRLPNMVLDAKSNDLFGAISNLPTGYVADQRMSLEGNFDSYFTLYAPSQYKTDALYVFTPDVMATMIDWGKEYDMEIIDDELYLYATAPFNITEPGELASLFRIVDVIQREVSEQTDYYRDSRVSNALETNMVAPAGRRLKRRPALVSILVILLIIGWQASMTFGRLSAPFTLLIIGVFVLYPIVSYLRH